METSDDASVADDASPSSGAGLGVLVPGIKGFGMGEGLPELQEGLVIGKGTGKRRTADEEDGEEEEHISNSGHCRAGTGNGIAPGRNQPLFEELRGCLWSV